MYCLKVKHQNLESGPCRLSMIVQCCFSAGHWYIRCAASSTVNLKMAFSSLGCKINGKKFCSIHVAYEFTKKVHTTAYLWNSGLCRCTRRWKAPWLYCLPSFKECSCNSQSKLRKTRWLPSVIFWRNHKYVWMRWNRQNLISQSQKLTWACCPGLRQQVVLSVWTMSWMQTFIWRWLQQ